MTVDKEDMDLKVNEFYLREADLDAHLTHESASDSQRPAVVMGYYLNPELRQRLRESEPEEQENEDKENFLIRFSKNLIVNAKSAKRPQMLRESQPILERVQKQENEKVARDLQKLGVDWSVGRDEGPSKVRVVAKTSAGDKAVKAGEPLSLEVKVTNEGKRTLYQLRATTESDNGLFNGRELVFGKLVPGETRSWRTTLGLCLTEDDKRACRVPRSSVDRADGITVEFEEAHGHVPPSVEVRTLIESVPQPRFAYGLQIADNLRGNGDGRVQVGEQVTVYFTVKNVGEAKTFDLQANLQNKSGQGILLYDGRFERKQSLGRGEEWVVPFTLQVLPEFEEDEAKLMLAVMDNELGVAAGQALTIPIDREIGAVENLPSKQVVRVSKGAEIRERPDPQAPLVGTLEDSARLLLTGRSQGFERINLGGGRPGWVAASATEAAQGKVASAPPIAWATPNASPRISVEGPEGFVTRGETIQLRGQATDQQRVRDLYITTSGHKVFYESNESSSTPDSLSFDAEIPVHPGMNTIMVVAREDSGSVTRHYFVLRRDAEDGSLMETERFKGALLANGNGHH
jgi:carboxyl-terminal processing protease